MANRGPAGPPEARGLRPVPFVPLGESGNASVCVCEEVCVCEGVCGARKCICVSGTERVSVGL